MKWFIHHFETERGFDVCRNVSILTLNVGALYTNMILFFNSKSKTRPDVILGS